MNKKVLYGAIVVIVLALLGGVAYTYNRNANSPSATKTTQTTPTPTPTAEQSSSSSSLGLNPAAHTVSYQGENGKTALAVLQEKYPDTQISGTGANAFVTAINGYTANTDKHEFWKFMVNGQDSQVGAGSYTTKSTDTIMWMIDTY